eukprot:gene25627-34196_t
MLIASLLKAVKHEAMEEELFLYEKDVEVPYCRGQSLCPQQFQEFSTFRRRHHCRHCGGIFCDSCLRKGIAAPNFDKILDLCCIGCGAGRSPGLNIRNCIEERVRSIGTSASNTQFDNDLKLGSRSPAITMPLLEGSPFDKKLLGKQKDNTPIAPSKGFFELVNKSDAVIGIKVLFVPAASAAASSVLWEVCRPVYVSLPPQESTHGFFPEDVVDLTLVLLHSNPHPLVPDISFQQANPTATITTPESGLPPKCCQIGEFVDYTAFAVRGVGQHNVLLKFKGGAGRYCDIEPRVGNSIQRVGVFTKLVKSTFGGSSKADPSSPASPSDSTESGSTTLDFSTNINAKALEFLHSSIRY